MIGRLLIGAAALVASLSAPAAMARPVTDCPNRDAPLSADSPLIDVLLSPAARALLDRGVRTGIYCAYEPAPGDPRWIVQSGVNGAAGG